MNYRLPILTLILALPAFTAASSFAETGSTVEKSGSGNRLIRQAARNLAIQPSLEAKLRHRVTLFGEYLVGSGSYRQLIIGDEKLFRLEISLRGDESTSSLLQVCNGETLWEQRRFGDTETVGFANVQSIHDAAGRAGRGKLDPTQLAIGGLDQLLRGLDECFVFSEPAAARIQSLPVWKLVGHWKPDQLGDKAAAGQGGGRTHVPDRVTVLLGREPPLVLFPYRVEYARQVPQSEDAASDAYEPLVTMELFEVQRYAEMAPKQHFYFPIASETRAVDITGEIISRMQ